MKRISVILLLTIVTISSFARNGYRKQYPYDQYNKDWALVKTVAGTYGFVDRNGKTIVAPVYAKIEKFGKYDERLAMVRSISDTYGFIDRQGKEVIPAIYERKDISSNFEAIYKKHTGKAAAN